MLQALIGCSNQGHMQAAAAAAATAEAATHGTGHSHPLCFTAADSLPDHSGNPKITIDLYPLICLTLTNTPMESHKPIT